MAVLQVPEMHACICQPSLLAPAMLASMRSVTWVIVPGEPDGSARRNCRLPGLLSEFVAYSPSDSSALLVKAQPVPELATERAFKATLPAAPETTASAKVASRE